MANEGLMMMRGILDWLYAIKKEMDEKGLTFEEFIKSYEEGLKKCEERTTEENCRRA